MSIGIVDDVIFFPLTAQREREKNAKVCPINKSDSYFRVKRRERKRILFMPWQCVSAISDKTTIKNADKIQRFFSLDTQTNFRHSRIKKNFYDCKNEKKYDINKKKTKTNK